jgi:hypothetical protein
MSSVSWHSGDCSPPTSPATWWSWPRTTSLVVSVRSGRCSRFRCSSPCWAPSRWRPSPSRGPVGVAAGTAGPPGGPPGGLSGARGRLRPFRRCRPPDGGVPGHARGRGNGYPECAGKTGLPRDALDRGDDDEHHPADRRPGDARQGAGGARPPRQGPAPGKRDLPVRRRIRGRRGRRGCPGSPFRPLGGWHCPSPWLCSLSRWASSMSVCRPPKPAIARLAAMRFRRGSLLDRLGDAEAVVYARTAVLRSRRARPAYCTSVGAVIRCAVA